MMEQFDEMSITNSKIEAFLDNKKSTTVNSSISGYLFKKSSGDCRVLANDIFDKLEIDNVKEEHSIDKIEKNNDYEDIMLTLSKNFSSFSKNPDVFSDYPFFRVQNTCKFIPKLDKESEILTKRHLRELHANIPYYQQYKNFRLLYSMSIDGTLLKTFYSKAEGVQNSILVVKDDIGNVFGAYISDYIQCLYNQFYGTAETFLFSFFDTERIKCFGATRINDYYIFSDDKHLAFGCSDDCFSLSLDNDFWDGFTYTTKTYNNLPLSKNSKFTVVKLELWTFE